MGDIDPLLFIVAMFRLYNHAFAIGGGRRCFVFRSDLSSLAKAYLRMLYFLWILFKCLFPVKLSYLYPFPSVVGEDLPGWLYFYPVFIVLFIFFFWKYVWKDKMLMFGLSLFAIHIAVTLHIIPLSRFAVVADRYAYLSSIGVAFLLVYILLIYYEKSVESGGGIKSYICIISFLFGNLY